MGKNLVLVFSMLLAFAACDSGITGGQSAAAAGLPEDPKLTDPALVTLYTKYEEKDQQSSQGNVTVRGSGFLVQWGERWLVATASHVSQGSELKVEAAGGVTLPIVGRLYDGIHDLELLEVTAPAGQNSSLKISESTIVWNAPVVPRAKWMDKTDFFLLNPWVNDPNLAADSQLGKTRATGFYVDSWANLLHSDSLVQPGASGSPLISRVMTEAERPDGLLQFDLREGIPSKTPAGTYVVRGIGVRRDRFYARSGFVATRWLMDLISRYAKGERTDESKVPVRWIYNGAVLCRYQKSGDLEETSVNSSSLSGGVISDSGNGSSMDGGNLEKMNENSPGAFLNKVSGFPSKEGKEISSWFVMMRTPPNGEFMSFLMYFDMEHYEPIERFVFATANEEGKELPLDADLKARLGGKTELIDPVSGAKLKFADKKTYVDAPLGTGDRVKLSFSSAGVPCKADGTCVGKFQPIIEAKSEKGKEVLVDLRGFFFVDFDSNKDTVFRDPKNQGVTGADWTNLFYKTLKEQVRIARFRYRLKAAGTKPMTAEQGFATEVSWTGN